MPVTESQPSLWKRRRLLLIASAAVLLVVSVAVAFQTADTNGATSASSPLIGRMAPPLSGETVTGGHVSLSEYRGRWVVLNIFASWCVPCQKETPELVSFARTHEGPGGAAVLGVVFQEDDGSARSFIAEHGVTWPLLAYRTMDQIAGFGVTGVPVTFLVSPDGRVTTKALGGLRPGQVNTLLVAAEASPARLSAPAAYPRRPDLRRP